MDPLADVEFCDRAVVFDDTLILADLHVGKSQSANVELPVGSESDMVDRFEGLCEQYDPETVVFAGDLLHSFQSVPPLVTETVSALEAASETYGVELVVTPGNHDTLLDAVWSGATTPEYRIGDTVVCHGHVEPAVDAARYVIGHDHPTITIEGRSHSCYLVGEGTYEGSDVIMLPAFNRLIKGVTVNEMTASDFMSPLITDPDALAPVVRDESDDETLTFPPLGTFRHKL